MNFGLFYQPELHRRHGTFCFCNEIDVLIVEAFRKVENANSDKLQGIFGDGAWTNKNRLPDRLLKDLLEHFSTKTLSIANCPEDELGQGYEYLIKKFADDSGHTAQEFYTNRTVVHLMTEMLKPESGESIYDPTCGSAGMLISAILPCKRLCHRSHGSSGGWSTSRAGQQCHMVPSEPAHGGIDFLSRRQSRRYGLCAADAYPC